MIKLINTLLSTLGAGCVIIFTFVGSLLTISFRPTIKNMKKITIVLLGLLFFTASCSSVKIKNNWDKEVEFDSFKTYSLFPWDQHNEEILNDYDKMTIQGAIKNEMNSRGYKHVEKNGELIISTFVIIEEKTSYQAYNYHYGGWAGYGGGWGYYGGPGYYGSGLTPTSTIYSTDYNQGTLIIDIFRLKDKRLVWQGIASGEVQTDLEKRDKRLPMTISQVFRRYPVTKKSQKKLSQTED
jgi:hypothetical protein